jgi:hypothetical protein
MYVCMYVCMLLSRPQNAGQTYDIEIANRSFGDVAQFQYLGTTVANQNTVQEEIERRLNSDNARYYSVLLYSRMLSKNVQVRIYKTIIFTVVL